MSTWYPGVMTYHQWQQAESFKEDIETVVKEQTNEIVASQAQTRQVISERFNRIAKVNAQGFNRIANVNEQGFQSVTNAIESLHADFNYYGGAIVQELEIQSGILRGILHTLKNPLKTQVEEFYNDGCRLVQEGILDKAIEKFTKAIQLDDTSFICYYQLGLLLLNGKADDENVIDVRNANQLLVTACRFGKGKAKADQNFRPVVANTLFFTSLSFYYQLNSPQPSELLDNATNYAEEALAYNANLSQAAYHLAKFYSLKGQTDKMLINLRKAIEMDLDYLFEVNNEKAFDRNRQAVNSLLSQMREEKRREAQEVLESINKNFNNLSAYEFRGTIYEIKHTDIKGIIRNIHQNYQINTYFGYVDVMRAFQEITPKIQILSTELETYTNELKIHQAEYRESIAQRKSQIPSSVWKVILFTLLGWWSGLIVGGIITYVRWMADSKMQDSWMLGCAIIGGVLGLIRGIVAMQDKYELDMKSIKDKYDAFVNSKKKN